MIGIEKVGDIGFWLGALGILAFTVAFLVAVRWWTDPLGRVLAAIFTAVSAVLVLSVIRIFEVDMPGGIFLWRAILYPLFAGTVWLGGAMFLWAQFIAPRVRKRRLDVRSELTTPPSDKEEVRK